MLLSGVLKFLFFFCYARTHILGGVGNVTKIYFRFNTLFITRRWEIPVISILLINASHRKSDHRILV